MENNKNSAPPNSSNSFNPDSIYPQAHSASSPNPSVVPPASYPATPNLSTPIVTPQPASPIVPQVDNLSAAVLQQSEAQEKPSRLKSFSLLIHVFAAFLCGAIFLEVWTKFTSKLAIKAGDKLQCATICNSHFLTYLLYALPLFLVIGVIISVKLKQLKAITAYIYAAFFLSLYFFFISDLAFSLSSVTNLSWLYENVWLSLRILPGLVAALGVLFVLLVQKIPFRHIAAILAIIILPAIIITNVLGPSTIKKVEAYAKIKQYNKEVSDSENSIKRASFSVLNTKNYNGPLKLYPLKADLRVGSDHRLIGVTTFASINNRDFEMAETDTAKFKPPKDCGSSLSVNSLEGDNAFPCRVVLTTPKDRKLYGYWSSVKLQSYGATIDSKDALRIQPDAFYVVVGNTLLSFEDLSDVYSDPTSPITPEVMKGFVDSLEPIAASEIHNFVINNIVGTKAANGIKD